MMIVMLFVLLVPSVVCFELLDFDQDRRLNRPEMKKALEMMIKIQEDNSPLPLPMGCSNNTGEPPSNVLPTKDNGEMGSSSSERQPCFDVGSLMEPLEAHFQVPIHVQFT